MERDNNLASAEVAVVGNQFSNGVLFTNPVKATKTTAEKLVEIEEFSEPATSLNSDDLIDDHNVFGKFKVSKRNLTDNY